MYMYMYVYAVCVNVCILKPLLGHSQHYTIFATISINDSNVNGSCYLLSAYEVLRAATNILIFPRPYKVCVIASL